MKKVVLYYHQIPIEVGWGYRIGKYLEATVKASNTSPTPCGQGTLKGEGCYESWSHAWKGDGQSRETLEKVN